MSRCPGCDLFLFCYDVLLDTLKQPTLYGATQPIAHSRRQTLSISCTCQSGSRSEVEFFSEDCLRAGLHGSVLCSRSSFGHRPVCHDADDNSVTRIRHSDIFVHGIIPALIFRSPRIFLFLLYFLVCE